MRVRLVVGDWSKDGHGQSDTYIYEVNLTKQDLLAAYKVGCKRLSLKVSAENYREAYLNFCEDYQDPKVPPEVVRALRAEGLDPDELFECWSGDGGDEDYVGTVDAWPELWLAIAKLGEPSLTYAQVYGDDSIEIGGYGLYSW